MNKKWHVQLDELIVLIAFMLVIFFLGAAVGIMAVK